MFMVITSCLQNLKFFNLFETNTYGVLSISLPVDNFLSTILSKIFKSVETRKNRRMLAQDSLIPAVSRENIDGSGENTTYTTTL